MGKHDIYMAMSWLIWRMDSNNRKKRSQEYIDRQARAKLESFQDDLFLSETVSEYARSHLQVPGTPGDGILDVACNKICKRMLREASLEDYQALLTANPRLRKDWEPIWRKIRSGRTRII